MEIILDVKLHIKVESCNFRHITSAFLYALVRIFEDFVTQVLEAHFEQELTNGTLQKRLCAVKITKKSKSTKTKFITLFGTIWVPQIQVRAHYADGSVHQVSLTRQLLDVSFKYQIPNFMKELLGWIGSMSTFGVGHAIMQAISGFKCSLGSVWRSVQYYANKIQLTLCPTGTNELEADGTGVPTVGSGKRGSELKKVFQRKTDGKLHLVGISIGKYKDLKDWTLAFGSSITDSLKQFDKVVVACDGDSSITDAALSFGPEVYIQKDKWHVFHQLKYYLWQDSVSKELKNNIIGRFYKITMLFQGMVEQRTKHINKYIWLLDNMGFTHTANYLQGVMEGFYTHENQDNNNIYTTKTERSMRTTNQRINVGVWSDDGALHVTKIRLAYYYNGISPLNWKNAP